MVQCLLQKTCMFLFILVHCWHLNTTFCAVPLSICGHSVVPEEFVGLQQGSNTSQSFLSWLKAFLKIQNASNNMPPIWKVLLKDLRWKTSGIVMFFLRVICAVSASLKGGYLPPQVLLHPSMAFSTSAPLHQVRDLRAEPRWTWMSSCSGQLTNLKVYIFFNVLFFFLWGGKNMHNPFWL